MPIVSQKSLETIRIQVSLNDAVAPYVQLKRAGRSWKGLSPFTNEKTPSFYVHPEKGFYKCFSTGKGGDIFSFYMEMENLSFSEAVEFIARRFNIPLEYEGGEQVKAGLSIRQALFDVHAYAAEWFHQHFNAPENELIRRYWTEERGFQLETANNLGIGYAPPARNALGAFLEKKRCSGEMLAKSGLFFNSKRDDERSLLARFRGRLMIPIRDLQGRVVAFTARQLAQTPDDDPAKEAKYVNSPETPLFTKGRVLFGLDHARGHLGEGEPFILVEGQLDAIRCWECGIHAAVASQGTALTEEQLLLLRRYEPSSVDVLLDGDKAGRAAAARLVQPAFNLGLPLRFLPLPDGIDPDGLFRKEGAAALEGLRAGARGPIELVIDNELPDGSGGSGGEVPALERQRCCEAVFAAIADVESGVVREDLLNEAARRMGIEQHLLHADFSRWQRKRPRRYTTAAQPTAPAGGMNGAGDAAEPSKLLTSVEGELLWLLLHFPENLEGVTQIIDNEWIESQKVEGKLVTRLIAEAREGLFESCQTFEQSAESAEERQCVAEIMTKDLKIEDIVQALSDCLSRLHKRYVRRQLNEVSQKILNADRARGEDIMLMRRRGELQKMMQLPVKLGLDS